MLASSCGGSTASEAPATDSAAETGAPAAAAACGPVETVPIQGGGQLLEGRTAPVKYNSTPPTSGWHASGDVAVKVYSAAEPLTEPGQVTVLELRGVVVSYNGLEEADVAILTGLVSGGFAGKAAVTPYDKLAEGAVD